MKRFEGRSILIIGIGFYDYEQGIVEKLESLGARVTLFDARPRSVTAPLVAPLMRRMPSLANLLQRAHERRMLEVCSRTTFDQLLIIKGTELHPDFLSAIRKQQPQAQAILYLWDSLSRLSGLETRLPFFDRIFTFDRLDANAHPDFKFRPLFFREPFTAKSTQRTDDPAAGISFIGWLHSDRLRILRQAEIIAEQTGICFYIYLYTGFLTWLRLTLVGRSRHIHFRKMSYQKVLKINSTSLAILDLPHPAQAGLTMRSIEALGAKTKLITTAQDIKNYDFFSENNISILNLLEQLSFNRSFLEQPFQSVPDKVLQRYSLESWLSDILGSAVRCI